MPDPQLVFVGTYTEQIRFGTGQLLDGKGRGIHSFWFDRSSGAMEPIGVTEGVRNPSYLAFDPTRRFLYAVNELKEFDGAPGGAVSAFRINSATGELNFLNMKASHGTDPCHLVVDRAGRNVLVANFSSGGVCVLPIAVDGSLEDASEIVQHEGSSVDPRRQAGPHAHAVAIDGANRFAFVPDLGLDKVMIYRFDPMQGRLELNPHQPFILTKPGAGPRQIVMHPNGSFAYLINELDSTITAFAYLQEAGSLKVLQTISTLPNGFEGRSTCAEVQIAPSGRFLYGSNRGHDSLAIYAVDQHDGTLRLVGHESTRGKIPRNFEVSPDGDFLAAANQDSNTVVSFRVDKASGQLNATGSIVGVGTPICVRFLP